MIIKIRPLRPDAKVPTKAHTWDACFDLTATSRSFNHDHRFWEYGTSLAFEIPHGFSGLIYPRSSISKYDLSLCNHVGVVDSGYQGEVLVRFKQTMYPQGVIGLYNPKIYKVGDRIAQMMIVPVLGVEFEMTDELEDSERGTSGFGGSGL
jgi:dUTP pyrophosphatase